MSLSARFVDLAKKILPSPFSIAILITLITMLLAMLFTEALPKEESSYPHFIQILMHWENGFFSLLKFTLQMMLILVLGHVLALSKPVDRLIEMVLKYCSNTSSAAVLVCFFTLLMAFFNWGLGLIFGAIFARKVGESMKRRNIPLNYPLIGAAAYSGLMVWHGGLSGSATADVASLDHALVAQIGVIGTDQTIFSTMNLITSAVLLTILPAVMWFLGKSSAEAPYTLPQELVIEEEKQVVSGADKLDFSRFFSLLIALLFCLVAAVKMYEVGFLRFFKLSNIIWLLFALGFLFHQNFHQFTKATEKAIGGSTGILIQFPLYAGIIGVMKGSGLLAVVSDAFVSISTASTFPFFAFLSAGIVNFFVPSGGGQWAVQGPILVNAAQELGVPITKCIMALVYGDQLTNMLQPFWALPLLGITGLKAKEILPYTIVLLLVGFVIFMSSLGLF